MAARGMRAEWVARFLALGLALGLPLAGLSLASQSPPKAVRVQAAMPESGGWMPGDLQARVGEPLHLALTSVDVVHGFAIGGQDFQAVDLQPGQVRELALTFDQPGTYTYYCTRWCGPNHWRMRGTIEVTGPGEPALPAPPPLFARLGLDIDAPHPAVATPAARPSAARGAGLGVKIPDRYLTQDYYREHSPSDLWFSLQAEPAFDGLSPEQIWDLVAMVWAANSDPATLQEGARLYAENCSACHGEAGAGDGVFASRIQEIVQGPGDHGLGPAGHDSSPPTDFTDSASLLGASPALLQGKIIRGGMGTGMPSWGGIFSEAELWALVEYLWTFGMGP